MPLVPARATGRATIAQGTLAGPDEWSTYYGPVSDVDHWVRSRLVAAERVVMVGGTDAPRSDRALVFRLGCVLTAVAGWLSGWGVSEWNWNCGRVVRDDDDERDWFLAPNDTAAEDERERYVSFVGPLQGMLGLWNVLGPNLSDSERTAMHAGTTQGVLYAGGALEPPPGVAFMSPAIARSALSRVYAAIPADVLARYGMPAAPGAASGGTTHTNNGGGGHATSPDTTPTPSRSQSGSGAMVALLLGGLWWASTRRRTR